MTVEKRTLNGILVGIISFSLAFTNSILLVPILLQFWGAETYGLWLSLFALFALLQTLDTGHQNYVGNEICKLYSTNFLVLKKLIASSIMMAVLLGISQLLIVLGIISFGFLGNFLGARPALLNDQRPGLGLICLVVTWILSGSIGGIIVNVYPAAGLYARSQWWGIIIRLAQSLSIILAAIISKQLLTATILMGLTITLVNLFLYVDVYRLFYQLHPIWKDGSWKMAWTNFSKSLVLTVAGILLQLQNNGLVLFISSLLGTAVAPTFTTMRTLSNAFVQATTIVTQPLLPEVIRYHVQGEYQKLTSVIAASWWSSGMLINFGILVSLPFVESIYLHWTRGKIDFDWVLYLLLAWSISLKNFGSPLNSYLAGINHLRAQSIITVVQTTTVLGGTFIFLSQSGLVAVGWAVVVGELFGSVLIPIQFTLQEIAHLGGNIPVLQIMLALASVVSVGIIFLGLGLSYLTPVLSAIIGSGILLSLYTIQWLNLPDDVKFRLISLCRQILSRKR
ncbi:hypothetical protein G7B40_026085 [Aetokthonos hydrillicola Thurmond2011]|jgi:O-antigen/teichoic acid export membrane protein|uniref:Polysaccharide biosynthesis protein n=1 Tax=Aetokthonos hydrillicola Thurmond2011 TaxID=2712845 RepID=A0AAP5IFF3_9CYAN|nr:hypothetical protein [Aetokthonos hydrillicola]MBO3460289.1 hypothetical protein [Aetokthonos hydrillicola CCALA 1050]MBW4587613.1 hypothetical protein [Aetokthonos hydrillicola CCALA 1050]MDR9898005.1 hypothetical protein [Aetokthonos hydrillicola Thurmond2011]